jgi:hypothetical protein
MRRTHRRVETHRTVERGRRGEQRPIGPILERFLAQKRLSPVDERERRERRAA